MKLNNEEYIKETDEYKYDIQVSDEEWAKVTKAAAKYGLKPNEYIKKKIIEAVTGVEVI